MRMLALLLLPSTALAGTARDAWGTKPVLEVTLQHRWSDLATCGLEPAQIERLRALGGAVASESDRLRREGDGALRDLAEPEALAFLQAQDQPARVAELAAWEALEAEAIAGNATTCLLDVLDRWWAHDRARGEPRVERTRGVVTVTCNVYATQYDAYTADEVAIPDFCVKFANLGWASTTCDGGGYEAGPYSVDMVRGSYSTNTPVYDVGPWNIDDNFWNEATHPDRPRRLFGDLDLCTNEARAAYYDGYNGGKDQYGRTVGNPAGVDLAVEMAGELGLSYLQNDWVDVTFPWEQETIFPVLWMGASIDPLGVQPDDTRPEGDSEGIVDVWPGQRWTVRFLVGNDGTDAANANTVVGIEAESPWLTVERWEVYSDWPNADQATWTWNSANDDTANPPQDGPGAAFDLRVHQISPTETKLIVLTVAAVEGSEGADHPDVRAFVKHVDDYYEKADFWATPTNVGAWQSYNGGDLRIWVEQDVWPLQTEWTFDDGTEGWYAGNDVTIGVADGALSVWPGGDDPFVISPPIEADATAFPALVLDGASDLGGDGAQLFWATADAPAFAEERSVVFTVPTNGATNEVVVPLEGVAGWEGTITRLRLDPAGGASGGWTVDAIRLGALPNGEDTGVEDTDDGGGRAIPPHERLGCGCQASAGGPAWIVLLALFGIRRRP